MLKYCTKCFPFMVLYAVLEHPRRFKLDQCPCGPFSNFSYSPQSHLVRRNYARRYYLSYKKRFYWQFLLIHNVRFLHLLKVIIMSTSHHKSIFVRLGESKHQNFRHPDHSLSPISFWNTTCYPEGIVIRRPPPLKLRRWRTRICQPKHSKPLVLCQVPRLVNMRRSHTRDLHAWFKENMTEVGNSFLIYPQDYRHQFSCVNSCRKFANRLANDSSYNMDVFAPSKAAHTIPWLILLTPCAPSFSSCPLFD